MSLGDPAPLPDAWLGRDPLPPDPMPVAARWLEEAWAAGSQRNPHAIALATADARGRPSVRILLCNEIDVAAGAIVFYSHHGSRKGVELAERPWAAAVFHWHDSGRQVRIEGPVALQGDAASDRYFATRPRDAQVGAWASRQSAPIGSRDELEARVEAEAARLGVPWPPVPGGAGDAAAGLPRPPHWGGYRLLAERVELWVSRPARIHDRAVWSRRLEGDTSSWRTGAWTVERLQP